MATMIAFLRAINVGGHTVKMEVLRGLFTQLGLNGVKTFIASGNVLFETGQEDRTALEAAIEQRLQDRLGYAVATFLRTPAELTDLVHYDPFPQLDVSQAGSRIYVGFLKSQPSPAAVARLAELRSDLDEFQVHRREVYWLCRTLSSESAFSGAVLEKVLEMPATMRNMTTARKIQELVQNG